MGLLDYYNLFEQVADPDDLEAIFAISVGIARAIFTFWFFIIEGPGPSVAPS